MASISGAANGLGNTALKGFGGWASGIDRDSIIEQMTLGTQTKITNKRQEIAKHQWKQEVYRSVSDKILDLIDNHFSYSSGMNLKDISAFAKNKITVLGDPDYTKFVTASGTSSMAEYLSILGVKQLAMAAAMESGEKATGSDSISTNIREDNLNDVVNKVSNLAGTKLVFGNYDTDGKFKEAGTFTFPTSYVDSDGKTQPIKYTDPPEVLAENLNKALESSKFTLPDGGSIKFGYDTGTRGITIERVAGTGGEEILDYTINSTTSSPALKALGFKSDDLSEDEIKDGISLDEYNANTKNTEDSYLTYQNWIDHLKDKEIKISYGGQTKTIKLLRSEDIEKLGKVDGKYVLEDTVDADGNTQKGLKSIMQDNIDRAFGKDKVDLTINGAGELGFTSSDSSTTISISANDNILLENLGIDKNESTKISKDSSIAKNVSKLLPPGSTEAQQNAFLDKLDSEGLIINGVKIEGVTRDTTINEMMGLINETPDAGVKATYLDGTNKFALIASETGTGRDITVDGAAAEIFGGTAKAGQDAVIEVSYGNGINTTVTSTTNTFNLEGMEVTVNGIFGYKEDGSLDSSQAVTFSAAADAEGVTEAVKKFIEDYNALIEEINKQVTTKPNKSFVPLTEEQKKEMSEESIKNWEEKGKQGLLFNDSTMRDLGLDMQGILAQVMQGGISYQDLEKIGITISGDTKDGGKLTFSENKFKDAMNSDSKLVSDIFTGGSSGRKGMTQIMEDTMSKYATRFGGKYGSSGHLIEEAGSNKIPSSLGNNLIDKQIKTMEEDLLTFQMRLESERDRYISQFTTMEMLISQMNSQASYLSNLEG